MARTVATIQAQIIADVITTFTALANDPNTSAADKQEILKFVANTSKRAIWRLWTHIVADAIVLNEQLMDVLQAEIEAIAANAAPATPNWIQDKVINYFQYDPNVPQVVQLINFIPKYPIEDPTLRIITRCSVTTDLSNNVHVKAAKQNPPVALSVAELASLQTFINTIGVAGINYLCESNPADQLYIKGTVDFFGSYSAVIRTNIIAGVNNFLASIPFNGVMKIIDLEKAIRNVEGVNDVRLETVRARSNGTPFISGTYLINSFTLVQSQWPTNAGYIIPETTAGNTLSDSGTLNLVAI